MPLPMLIQADDDRRRHPRRPSNLPLVLEMMRDGDLIPCDTLDVSIDGMRVRAMEPIPLGPCDIVVFADTDDPLTLMGEVIEIIESTAERTIAGIIFLPILSRSADADADAGHGAETVAVVGRPHADAPHRHRHGMIALAASIAAGLVSVVGVHFATEPVDRAADVPAAVARALAEAPMPTAPSTGASVSTPAVQPAPATVPAPVVASAPRNAPVNPPTTVETTTRPVIAAPMARVEHADDPVHVTLGSTAEDTAVSAFAGPSEGVDQVRVQLNVTPEPDGTRLPVEVTFENRGDHLIAFPDGFHATITSTRDGVVIATAVFTSDIRDVAPGQTVAVDGVFDLTSLGEHDLTVDIDTAE